MQIIDSELRPFIVRREEVFYGNFIMPARHACRKGYIFRVEFEMSISISPSLLVRLSPSLVNVYASSPVFIASVFLFDLGCMLVNWDRLLILL